MGADVGGAGCPKRDASKSSSSRAGTVEKIPVALEGGPEGSAPGRSAPNESGLSNGLLDALIDDHPRFPLKSMVMDTQTTSLSLDSKGLAAYDASTLDGSEVRSG